MRSVSEVIEAFGGATAVASSLDVPPTTVASWKYRDSIPDEYRPSLVDLARERWIEGVTYETLTLMHTEKEPENNPAQ